MDGWNTSFLLGWPIFRCYVSFREGIYIGHLGNQKSLAQANIKQESTSHDFLVLFKLETSKILTYLDLFSWCFFTDCAMGSITIIHHHLGKNIVCFFSSILSGQIIATSHDRFSPNGGLVREMGPRLFQGNRVVGEIL